MLYCPKRKDRINTALRYPDASWAYHQMLKSSDRELMDELLVRIAHPLAFQAGTVEYRFCMLHAAHFQFDGYYIPHVAAENDGEQSRALPLTPEEPP